MTSLFIGKQCKEYFIFPTTSSGFVIMHCIHMILFITFPLHLHSFQLRRFFHIPKVILQPSYHSRRSVFLGAENPLKTLSPGSHVSEIGVKKSRFLGYAQNVENWDEAKNYIEEVRREHPKARHWCFGFRCGNNPVQERCSDDGEPTGTAGVPILGAIKGEDLSDVVCVVVRYFGGIKLGAGGLIRAYGGAARQVLREAPFTIHEPKVVLRVSVESSLVGTIYETASRFRAGTGREEYLADGSFQATITCDLELELQLREYLIDSTKGNVVFVDDE